MEQLHYLTLQLVRLCKSFQRKSLAQNTALMALIHEGAEVRAALTPAHVEEMIASADEGATVIVDREFSELEEALLDGTDFLPALQRYLDRNL
jgi:hypothetical protein